MSENRVWIDNGTKSQVSDVKEFVREHLATGKYDSLIIGCDSCATPRRGMHTFGIAVICDTETITDSTTQGRKIVYTRERVEKTTIAEMNRRILKEVELSIAIGHELLEVADEFGIKIGIHADCNNDKKAKSSSIVKEVIGWIEGCGFECHVKPSEMSWAASAVADRVANN